MGLLPAAVALAGPVGNASGFEDDDGNLVVNSTFDWNGFDPTAWTGTAPNRQSTKTASGWQFLGLEDAQAANGDTSFAGGTKQDDNCATVGTGKAPNKDDLKRIYVSSKDVGGKTFLNLAWVRIPQNTTSASAHVGFEFNKGTSRGVRRIGPRRTDGRRHADRLRLRGRRRTPRAHPPSLDHQRDVRGRQQQRSVLGRRDEPDRRRLRRGAGQRRLRRLSTRSRRPDETLQDSEFGEAGINLTDSGVFPAGSCNSFGKVFGVSRSSGNSSRPR